MLVYKYGYAGVERSVACRTSEEQARSKDTARVSPATTRANIWDKISVPSAISSFGRKFKNSSRVLPADWRAKKPNQVQNIHFEYEFINLGKTENS